MNLPHIDEMYDKILKDPWATFYLKDTIRGVRDYNSGELEPRLTSSGNALTVRSFCAIIWQCLKILRPDLLFVPAYPDFVLKNAPIVFSSPPGVNDAEMTMWIEKYNNNLPVPKLIEDSIKKLIPAKSIPNETITWIIKRQTPGTIGSSPFNQRRELKGRTRDIIDVVGKDPISGIQNNGIEVRKGQWMDNLVQFDIWTKDNSTAEDLAEWFKAFMGEYEGIFLERGIQKVLFWERLKDETILQWRNSLVNRSLQWYVRTEELVIRNIPKIREINIYLKRLEEQFLTRREVNEQISPSTN